MDKKGSLSIEGVQSHGGQRDTGIFGQIPQTKALDFIEFLSFIVPLLIFSSGILLGHHFNSEDTSSPLPIDSS